MFNIRDVLETSQREIVLAAWCLSAFDVDRSVTREANRSWSRCVKWITPSAEGGNEGQSILALESDELANALSDLLCQTLLDPYAFYTTVFPAVHQVEQPLPQHGRRMPVRLPSQGETISRDEEAPRRAEAEEENEDDRKARLRVGSLGALKWLIGALQFPPSPTKSTV